MHGVNRELFIHEYPRLLEALRRIVARIQSSDETDIASLILFGSIARLTPHLHSDTDLLVLFANARGWAEFDAPLTTTLHIIHAAEDKTMDDNYRWHIVPIPADAHASDLDPSFLESIARDGVLLYQRDGYTRPAPLRSLEPFADWEARLRQQLAILAKS